MKEVRKIPGERKKITTEITATTIKQPPKLMPLGSLEPQFGHLEAVV
jgi:hypothetical protein